MIDLFVAYCASHPVLFAIIFSIIFGSIIAGAGTFYQKINGYPSGYDTKYHRILYWFSIITIFPIILFGFYFIIKYCITYFIAAAVELKNDMPEKIIKPKKPKKSISSGDLSICESGGLSLPENKIKIKKYKADLKSRKMTKIESQNYQQSLKKMFKPTGKNICDM